MRGTFGLRPHVHNGFLHSWSTNGLNAQVVDRMQQRVQDLQAQGRTVKVYVTGASLCYAQCRLPGNL